jgi:hypothetical protein
MPEPRPGKRIRLYCDDGHEKRTIQSFTVDGMGRVFFYFRRGDGSESQVLRREEDGTAENLSAHPIPPGTGTGQILASPVVRRVFTCRGCGRNVPTNEARLRAGLLKAAEAGIWEIPLSIL